MDGLERLLEIMRQLRNPEGGCPWDREQTFETIVPYTIEEAYEVAEAIERGDNDELRDELGDLLFQVVFYAQMAREQGLFEFKDVVDAVCAKLVRRHPHVFADESVDSAHAQTAAWEAHKAQEREERAANQGVRASLLDEIPKALPALVRAGKLQRRAARVGFDWQEAAAVLDKVMEEIGELRSQMTESPADGQQLEAELGDVLFAVGNLARHLGVDAETALRKANRRFERRFRYIEGSLARSGRDPRETHLSELEALWAAAKRQEDTAEGQD